VAMAPRDFLEKYISVEKLMDSVDVDVDDQEAISIRNPVDPINAGERRCGGCRDCALGSGCVCGVGRTM